MRAQWVIFGNDDAHLAKCGPTLEKTKDQRVTGPGRPLLGVFKSSSGTLGIWDGQHEAHLARRAPTRANCFPAALMAAPVPWSAGRSADSQWAPDGLRRSFRPGG